MSSAIDNYLVGKTFPNRKVWVLPPRPPGDTGGPRSPEAVNTHDLFRGKYVVVFAVPGPFTPGCSKAHAPGYLREQEALRRKGIDAIYCISTADAFVMEAWSDSLGNDKGHLVMLSDGNLELTRALGMVMDGEARGMGERSLRYAMVVRDLRIEYVTVDEGKVDATRAEKILSKL